MTAAPDPTTNVAVELAQLRGEINTGLESIKGTLGILVERTTRTDADVKHLRTDVEAEFQKIREDELKPLKAEIESLKRSRWPLAQLGALVGIAGVAAAVIALFVH